MSQHSAQLRYELSNVLMMTRTERIKNNLPTSERELARRYDLARGTIRLWDATKEEFIANYEGKEITELESGLSALDSDKKDAILNKLYDLSVTRGVVKAAELWLKAKGELIEKREEKVTIELSADEIARRNLQAEHELRQSGHRMEEMQAKPRILPEELCLDSGQEHSEEDSVASVELSS